MDKLTKTCPRILLTSGYLYNQFAGGFMFRKLFGEMSVTYAYSVLLIYIVAWIITVYYVLRTDREEEAH